VTALSAVNEGHVLRAMNEVYYWLARHVDVVVVVGIAAGLILLAVVGAVRVALEGREPPGEEWTQAGRRT
jgi:predicted lysophospholipase L1 biosynthesis ABC-type transport system permease subunit